MHARLLTGSLPEVILNTCQLVLTLSYFQYEVVAGRILVSMCLICGRIFLSLHMISKLPRLQICTAVFVLQPVHNTS